MQEQRFLPQRSAVHARSAASDTRPQRPRLQQGPPRHLSIDPAAATATPQPTPQPKTKQEWMMHLLNKIAPPQNVVTTNPDGTQTVENRATPVSLAQLVLTSALAARSERRIRIGRAHTGQSSTDKRATPTHSIGASK